MNDKKLKKEICAEINHPATIIKARRKYSNGDTTIRYGKGGKMQDPTIKDILTAIQTMDNKFEKRFEAVDKQISDMDNRIDARLTKIEKDIVVMKEDIRLMKNTPTMKKELNSN